MYQANQDQTPDPALKLHLKVIRILSVATALACLYPIYNFQLGIDTAFFKFLFDVYIGDEIKPDLMQWFIILDKGLFVAIIIAAWEVLTSRRNTLFISFIFLWFLGTSWIKHYFDNQSPFTLWTPLNHGLRYLVPLALLMLIYKTKRGEKLGIDSPDAGGLWMALLRIGTAMTFIGHGLAAYWGKPEFIGFVNGTLMNIDENWRIAEDITAINYILKPIAIMDITLGSILLIPSKRFWPYLKWISLYLSFWALITACSRVTSGGWGMWPELVIRATYVTGPFCLYLYFKTQLRIQTLQSQAILNTHE